MHRNGKNIFPKFKRGKKNPTCPLTLTYYYKTFHMVVVLADTELRSAGGFFPSSIIDDDCTGTGVESKRECTVKSGAWINENFC